MHTWIFGATGTGKTTALVHRALENIDAGEGVLFVDPAGHAIDGLLSRFPKKRTQDVLYVDPTDAAHPVAWNILHGAGDKPLLASILRDTMKALWNYTGAATPVMDRMLYATIAALLECPDATLLSIEPMLTNSRFRDRVLKRLSDPVLKEKWSYWESLPPRDWRQLIASTENKVGEFSEDPRIRAIIGQPKSSFDLRKLIFQRNVILLRLPQGQLGIQKSSMLGSLFLAQVLAVASSRNVAIPFRVYLDEFQQFDTPVLRQLISSGRRLGVSLTLANQYLAQLSPELRSSVIANCDRVMFRCGIDDSEYLHRTIPYDNTLPKLHELTKHEALTFAEGELSRVRAEPLPGSGTRARRRAVVEQSRRRYASNVLADLSET